MTRRFGLLVFLVAALSSMVLFGTALAASERTFRFTEPIQSAAPVKEGVAVLSGWELWLCPLGENAGEARLKMTDVFADLIFADAEGQLCGVFQSESGYTVSSLGLADQTSSALFSLSAEEAPDGRLRQVLVNGDNIVLVFQEDPLAGDTLLIYDRAQRTERLWRDTGAQVVASAEVGSLLGFSHAQVVRLDLAKQTVSTLFETSEQVYTLGYASADGTIVELTASSAILAGPSGAQEREIPLSLTTAMDFRQIGFVVEQQLVLADGLLLRIVPLQGSAPETGESLMIQSFTEEGSETRRFRVSHPEQAVQTRNRGYTFTPAAICQEIRSGESETDIFLLRTFETGYSALLDGGFCADLSSSAKLCEAVQGIPESLSGAVQRDGKLLAVPLSLAFDDWWQLDCSAEMLAEAGIDPASLPDNLVELFEQLTAWYEDGTLADVRLFDFDAERQVRIVTWFALQHYVRYMAAEDRQISFDTELFRTLMTACDGLVHALRRQTSMSNQSPALLQYVASPQEEASEGEQIVRLTLSPAPGMEPRCSAYMTVAVVNPRSQHQAAAVSYLEAVLSELPAEERLLLWPDQAEPVERAGFQEDYDSAKTEVQLLKEALESGEDPSLREDLAKMETGLARMEEDRWQLSPERIDAYRAYAPQVFALTDVSERVILDDQTQAKLQQYADGQLDMAAFVSELIRRGEMMDREDQR